MKKQFLLFFLLPLFAFNGFDWVTVKIDDRVSLNFPATPEEKEMSGNLVLVSDVSIDARCMIMVMDFAKMGMDSIQLREEMAKPTSFEEFRDGVLGQIENSSIISENKNTFRGYTTFEFVIDMGKTDATAFNVMYNRNLFIGTKMYSMSFYERTGNPQEADRKKFFNSVRVN